MTDYDQVPCVVIIFYFNWRVYFLTRLVLCAYVVIPGNSYQRAWIKRLSRPRTDAKQMQSDLPNRAAYRLTFTRKANSKFSNKFKERIIGVFQYFPELHDDFVRVGWIRPGGWARGSCSCSNTPTLKPLKINLQPNEKNFTIAHEFTHLLQVRKKQELRIPSGEKACDLWALTRLPLELIDDCPSYVGSHQMRNQWLVVKRRVRELAFDAIEIRKVKRQYIVWFEGEIRKLDKQF